MSIYIYMLALTLLIGLVGFYIKRNLISLIRCLQVIFGSLNLFFAILSHNLGNLEGQVFVFFSLILTAINLVIGLIIIAIAFRNKNILFQDEIPLKIS